MGNSVEIENKLYRNIDSAKTKFNKLSKEYEKSKSPKDFLGEKFYDW